MKEFQLLKWNYYWIDGSSFTSYRGKRLHKSNTFCLQDFSIDKSLGFNNLSAMISPTFTNASSLNPLVVRAAVPNLKPLVTNGDSGSKRNSIFVSCDVHFAY